MLRALFPGCTLGQAEALDQALRAVRALEHEGITSDEELTIINETKKLAMHSFGYSNWEQFSQDQPKWSQEIMGQIRTSQNFRRYGDMM